MAQKKKTVKKRKTEIKKTNQAVMKEVSGILVLALGVLIFFGIYFKVSTGMFGVFISGLLSGLFGWTYKLIPFLVVILGLYLIFTGMTDKLRNKSSYFIAMVLLISCFFHIVYLDRNPGLYQNISFFKVIAKFYTDGKALAGGGLFGGLFITPVRAVFGIAGAYIITSALALINLILFTNRSFKNFIINIKKIFVSIAKWMAESFRPLEDQISDQEKLEKRKNRKQEKQANAYVQQEIDINPHKKQIDFSLENKKMEPEVHEETLQEKIDRRRAKPLRQANAPEETVIQTKTVEKEIKGTPMASASGYKIPPLSLLEDSVYEGNTTNNSVQTARKLEETLLSFGVEAKVVDFSRGPSVTRYELQPKVGVKVSRITSLADDIALNLASRDVRIEAPIPGKAVVGIEVPNKEKSVVSLKEILASKEFQQSTSPVSIAIGKDIGGKPVVADIRKMPHMLIAGATGSGKSVCINCIITSILYKASPEEVKLLMIDPKKVELGNYNGIPHLLIPVVNNVKKAAGALNWAVVEMTSRYDKFSEVGARDIASYNDRVKDMDDHQVLPHIVIIIDELADLMASAPGEVEDSICRLAQLARAAGMHLIIATQRPSVNVITGLIKANIPSRVSFAVVSQIDSRTILDMAGAEKLLGKGDMLFHPIGMSKPVRVQGAFVGDQELLKVVSYIKEQTQSNYDQDVIEEINSKDGSGKDDALSNEVDEYLAQAVDMIIDAGSASVSYVQRKFKVGYARAARIIDQMEERGIVGPFEGSKPRQVLVTKDEWAEMQMQNPSDYKVG
ncbi:MAG: DNA translocase FtsK 4TM domain-containing protein [Clostridia bacterium]|nr:DNA translocase FtsK 4TM domain-containing protein [Clostridia bacterium]